MAYDFRKQYEGTMNMHRLKERVPWWGKMIGHLAANALPVGYQFWHKLGVLKHGQMSDPAYAYAAFRTHFDRVSFPRSSTAWVGLELGPGDSVSSALVARAFGCSQYYLVDRGDFAQKDVHTYRKMLVFLEEKGLHVPAGMNALDSFQDVLSLCNATYGTEGLSSLKAIPTKSVDYIWSHGVLQSVRLREFPEYIAELRRIIRDDGASSHLIPLIDLSAGALHHLRFPEWLWESEPFARCGFYANRLRYSEMLHIFRTAGFTVNVIALNRWKDLPTPRSKLARRFRALPDDELSVSGFEVVLMPGTMAASMSARAG